MKKQTSALKLAENEVVFRQANERVQEDLHDLQKQAEQEGYEDLYGDRGGKETPLHFYCECSNEKCHERIVMAPSEYKKHHTSKTMFVVLPGHEVPEVERVINKFQNFFVVDKFITPPSKADHLNTTNQNAQ